MIFKLICWSVLVLVFILVYPLVACFERQRRGRWKVGEWMD
jgi:hypothetical protein